MKLLIVGSILYLSIASAFGAGYYEQNVAPCDAASMRRAMDAATARTGAGITVVKCAAAEQQRVAVAPAAPVVYVAEPAPRPVMYAGYADDYNGPMCGGCGMRYAY